MNSFHEGKYQLELKFHATAFQNIPFFDTLFLSLFLTKSFRV